MGWGAKDRVGVPESGRTSPRKVSQAPNTALPWPQTSWPDPPSCESAALPPASTAALPRGVAPGGQWRARSGEWGTQDGSADLVRLDSPRGAGDSRRRLERRPALPFLKLQLCGPRSHGRSPLLWRCGDRSPPPSTTSRLTGVRASDRQEALRGRIRSPDAKGRQESWIR